MYKSTLGAILHQAGVIETPPWMNRIKIKHEPMPHQLDMAKLYLTHERYADFAEAGSGKTLPSHLHGILMSALGNRVVYTMPPKLIDQFHEEMLDWFPGIGKHLSIATLNHSAAKKKKLHAQWDKEGWPDILMVSYDGYREFNDVHKKKKIGPNQWYDEGGNHVDREYKGAKFTKDGRPINKSGYAKNDKHRLLTRRGYNVFFFDEAHALCSLKSIISKSVAASLEEDECAIYLMTGTPVPAIISDAYGIIRLINPEAYRNEASFERQHVVKKPMTIRKGARRMTIRVPDHYIHTDKIHTELFRYARRIEKRDVIKLKDPLIDNLEVSLSAKHMRLYKKFMSDHFAVVGNTVLSPESQQEARHMAMKLIACPTVFDPSIPMETDLFDALKVKLDGINPWQHKVVIFAYHREVTDFLAEKLSEYNPAMIRGGSSAGQEKKFREDDSCRVIILNWRSGGAGLNLQIASHVLFFEVPNATEAEQGIARCDRAGQTENVSVTFLTVRNTLSSKKFVKMLKGGRDLNEVIHDNDKALLEAFA